MKPITTGRNRFVLVAIGLMIVVLAYAGATQSSSAGQDSPGASSGEAQKRQEAEAAVVRTGAVNEMEAALGDAFGGAWFDESAPLLRIGVISSESRSTVEAVAARLGLADIVVPTPVRSTRPELLAAQEELNRQLADLFAHGEVGTLLQPQHNSVLVQLGSDVPAKRRAELNRDTALTGVDVAIESMDRPQLGPRPESRCNEWKQHNAFCNKPIVAGVTIEAKKGCSAGPAIRATDPKLPTSTFILTAGHCIVNGGGYDEKWFAFDKSAHKTEIGKAIQYLVSEKGDVGVVTVAPGSYWSEKGSVPVEPTIAPFVAGKKEPEPFPVVGKNLPTVNMMSCRVGEASPLSCGKITGENGTFESLKGVTVKGLITVSGANSAVGDSGGPWFAKAQYEEVPSKGWVDGTHVGADEGTNVRYFMSIDTALKELKSYVLLTQSGQYRKHPTFTAESYPVTVSAVDTTSDDEFTAFGATITCTKNQFHGSLTAAEQEEDPVAIEVTPTYEACTGPLGVPVVATSNGCEFQYALDEESQVSEGQYDAGVAIVCPEGKAGLEFHVYSSHANLTSGTAMCTMTVPPQTVAGAVTMTNSGGDVVVDADTFEGVKVKIHRTSFLCPSSGTESETTSGVYHFNEPVTVDGSSGGEPIGIDIGVE